MDWQKSLELSDDQLEEIRYVGYCYIQQGCYETAFTYFNALEMLNPSSYDLQTLGSLYLIKKDNLKALESFDKAIQKNPQNYLAILNRIHALLALGYKKQALIQAKALENCTDKKIADQASAIVKSQTFA